MAILKQIKFGTGNATPIAQTIVTAASDSVLSVNGTNTKLTDEDNPSYEVDLKIDNATLVKSTDSNKVLKVGTVPAAQVSVAEGTGLTASDAQTAFKELKDDIKKVISDGKTYSIVDDTKNDKSLPTNVLKRYRLQETVGSKKDLVGEPIDILKDNSLLAAKLSTMDAVWTNSTIVDGTGAEALVLVYKDANGDAQVIHIDVSTFLAESEFKDGLQVTDHVVSVKIDPTSEKFLTVGEGGVKLAGVQNAINTAVSTAVEGLDFDDTIEPGQYVSKVSETDGKIAVERANVSDAVLNGYAKGTDATAILATDPLKAALGKLENQVDKAKAAATTKVAEGTDDGNNLSIDTRNNADGSVTYTVNLTDVASKAALDAEIAARKAVDGQSGDGYVANGNTNYISGAASLNDADVKLDTALKAEADRAQKAEKEIADKVGLTGDEGARTFAPTTNYGADSTSVVGNMQKLDTKLKEVADGLAAVQYKVNGTTLEFFGISLKTV